MDAALRTRDPTRQLNIVGWNEEDLPNLLSPNSLVSAASGKLRPSTPAFQMPDKYFRGVAAGQTFERQLNAHHSERTVLLMEEKWLHNTQCPGVHAIYKLVSTVDNIAKYNQYLSVSLVIADSLR